MKRTREGMRHIRHWRNRAASGNVYKGIAAGLLGGLIAPWAMNQWLTLWQRLVTEDTAPRRGRLVAGQGGQLARHGPPLANLVLPDVMGSLLEFQSSAETPLFQLYITGDTLVIDDWQEIPRRYPQIDLALLHLGGTRLLGILVTMDGKQGVQLMQMVAPQCSIPIHYNDYDVFTSPLTDFQQEVQATGLEERVHYLHHGDTYTFTVASTREE